ncbi:MAG: GC-type dockerin domain-anchored protein, partial [Planctomycetota bacterium]
VVGAGIWRSDDGVISKVIRTGDDAPALPGETVLSLGGPLVTADGRAIFSGQASGSSFEVPNNTLWSSGLASTEVIAQSDDSAPGLFAASLGPIIFFEANGAGDVLLITEPNAVVTPVDRALFSIPRNGPRQLLIGENLIAPSLFGATVASIASGATTPSGGAFFSGVLQPGAAGVTNQNDRVLWQRAGDSTRVFLREGDPAPPSRDFEHDFPVAAIGNAAGDALFVTRLRDTDEQPSPTRSAIGVFDGERRRFGLLAVEGVRFDASLLQDRSDLRFLDRINTLLVSVDSGRPRYLSDQGVALYGLEFDDDSSGVFVSSITQPCSPADLSLPFGILNSSDINRFVSSFLAGSTRVDFAEPFGFINSSDINAFVSAFLAGCE